jgi:hypothetical protein
MSAWLLLLACPGVAFAGASQPSLEGISAQARFLAPDISALAGPSAAQVPSAFPVLVPSAAAASSSGGPLAIYEDVVRHSAVHTLGLTVPQRQLVWDAVFHDPVAGLDDDKKLKKYDPQGFIGFCFGRSMAVHLMARQMGLAEDSVRQLFIIGELDVSAQTKWRFHVTALVRGDDGIWYAIDPLMAGPVSAAAWVASVRAWDKNRKAHLYAASADTVLPDLTVVPDLDMETGSRIIEISFEPAGKPGLLSMAGLGDEVFEVAPEAAAQYFRGVESPANPFDFESIRINGQLISYNGYFVDFLNDFGGAVQLPMRSGASEPAARKGWPLGLRMDGLAP